MAATADSVDIAAGDKCVRLDAESGRRLAAFEMPNAGDHHPRVWGYVCVVGDRLLGTAAFPGASLTTHSKDTIGGTYYDGQAIVTATSLFCLDRDSGKVLWNYDGQTGAIGHPTLCVADGRVHFFETSAEKSLAFDRANRGREPVTTFLGTDGSAARLVALDLADGKPIYREQIKLPSAQHIVFLSAADGRLLVTTSRNAKAQGAGRLTLWYDFTALDAATGRHLWYHEWHTGIGTGGSHGEQDQHPAIVGNRMYLRDISVDMETGKRISGWQWNRSGHGCGTFSASNDALFFRGANPTMCSLSTGKNAKLTTVTRPGCWINIVPAAGLILIPEASSGCTCGFSVQTSMALAPGKD